jgi:IS5 family transposase
MRRAPTGRPAYPPLVQLKALLLQQWYRPPDRDLEEALADRLSFRRFSGLVLEDAVPDATTLSRFRIDLAEAGLAEMVFDALNAQLEQRGLFIKAGTMIDATLVEADVTRPPMREGEVSERIQQLASPVEGSAASLATRRTWRWIRGRPDPQGDPHQRRYRRKHRCRCAHLR